MAKIQMWQVYDGKSYIGSYRAVSEKAAIARAQSETNAGCSTFRRSQAPIYFKAPYATLEFLSYEQRRG